MSLIDDLKEKIKKLELQNELLQSVIDSIPGCIYWKDKEGVYLGRNQQAADKTYNDKLTESTQKDFAIGKTDYDFVPKETADQYHQNDLEVIATGQSLSKEEYCLLPNGQRIIQLSQKKPLKDKEGNIIGIVGNTIDITHLKNIEAELKFTRDLAEQNTRLQTEFIRNMEHDIRTPFCGIIGLCEILLEKEKECEKQKLLRGIHQSAKELLEYCNTILDFSKIEGEDRPIYSKPFHLKPLIEKVLNMERVAAEAKGLAIDFHYPNHIPNILIGDEFRLFRILVNLVSNAVKFTAKGFVKVSVNLVDQSRKAVVLKIDVHDTGIGIPAHQQNIIYEKFVRGTPRNQNRYRGSGLGLYIVKHFVKDMGGEILLSTKEGEGTIFSCVLPFSLSLLPNQDEKNNDYENLVS